MPRYLYLLRHAQSADKQIGQSDKERELTPTGIKQTIRIASFLLREKTFPDAILSSSAERTRATTTLIADALKIEPERIFFEDELYEASTRTLLQTVAHLENNLQHVMCIGHNPAISYLAEFLTKAEIGEMVPAGMAIIKFNVESWAALMDVNGELVNYLEPDKITY
jgi:phosphohistidine phosphatase